jgi:hypothetical protein
MLSVQLAQVVAARSEFVPPPVCAALATLHDREPPAPPAAVRAAIERELGRAPLESVFEWIDLETPMGSASVAQVGVAFQAHACHACHLHNNLIESLGALWVPVTAVFEWIDLETPLGSASVAQVGPWCLLERHACHLQDNLFVVDQRAGSSLWLSGSTSKPPWDLLQRHRWGVSNNGCTHLPTMHATCNTVTPCRLQAVLI